MIPLFAQYPRLQETLPHASLGEWPTPFERMERIEASLGGALGGGRLYIKRDDLSAQRYGGNKVRKLEFLLGRAVHDGRKAVLTFGAAGSNHALATAIYARQLGLRSISVLVPQPNARSVGRNLLMSYHVGAELHYYPGMRYAAPGALSICVRCRLKEGRFPYLIPPGGSSPLGMIGFVNAALELRDQLAAQNIPPPDALYVASGTMGTAVGLLLGLKAAGLSTRVEAVRVTDPLYTSMRKAQRLYSAANNLLHKADGSFPLLPFSEPDFRIRHDFYGEAYGLYTKEGMDSVRRLKELEDMDIEGTYTGKTMAALLADAEAGRLRDQTALFWNTYNGRDFSNEIAGIDYHQLPQAFHRYFEDPLQPLESGIVCLSSEACNRLAG
jgi:D-cysteine desulfhydrase